MIFATLLNLLVVVRKKNGGSQICSQTKGGGGILELLVDEFRVAPFWGEPFVELNKVTRFMIPGSLFWFVIVIVASF